MLATISRILGYQLTIAQLIALGLILGTPYLLVGAIWSTTHTAHLQNMHGGRSGGVVPRLDRVLAGAAVLERLHDMTAADRRHPDSHISVGGQT